MAMAQEDGASPPFDRRLVDALLAGSEEARELIRSRPRDAHEIFHGYLDSAIALELDGSSNRVRVAWDIGERLAPLYDAVRGGQALTEALGRYRELREKHAARKALADRQLGSAEASFRAGRAGEAGAVVEPAEEALAIYREIGDPRGAARAHRLLAEAPRDGSDIEAVVRHLTEAARLHGAAGNGWEEIDALARLAEALARSGAFLLARGEYGRALDRLLASLDATSGRADLGAARKRALLQVAGAYDEVGLFEPAESCLREALQLDRATGGDLEADCLSLLARIALDRGESSRAEELLREAMALPACSGR
jgi:tetratricopeptide (TPR) repeat protein